VSEVITGTLRATTQQVILLIYFSFVLDGTVRSAQLPHGTKLVCHLKCLLGFAQCDSVENVLETALNCIKTITIKSYLY